MDYQHVSHNDAHGTILTGLIVLTATVLTALVVWNVLAPHATMTTVLVGEEARTIVSMLFDVLYDALAHLLRYISKAPALVS
jgi:hypothetical protein